ncbi:DNA polymerase III PolC-type [Vibrio aerogenes CECT 7868]|uniref:DNA polymerase III PolC-type n=1 Tax=Vibrio aerogenes CECT 7868 TaxID=1216006 RepID=A0A1M5YSC7_9VIBR|nr:3'-5' exonuclease [Vibrio aerogenes]SHI14839.1 DNA polymerase III PolC-type [Vibrio aerogenes CECT 7868]
MNWLRRIYWYGKLKDSDYRPLFRTTKHHEYVALDCETTSLNPRLAQLVTIAAVKVVHNRIVTSQSFEVHLKAPGTLDEHSVKIHQMRHQDLAHGLAEQDALKQLIQFIGNRPLIGYHIRYDKTILDLACRKHLGFPLPNQIIEVSQIYQQKLETQLPNAYFDLSLDVICHQLNLPSPERHNALQDAISAALIYIRLTYGDLPVLTSPSVTKPHIFHPPYPKV